MICALVASSGQEYLGVPRLHLSPCDYGEQFHAEGSTIYQLAHVPTSYPAQHDGIIIDEYNPPASSPRAGDHGWEAPGCRSRRSHRQLR